MQKTSLLLFLFPLFGWGQTLDWTKQANPFDLPINTLAFTNNGQKILSGTDCHPASIRMFDVDSSNLDWDYTVGDAFECIMGLALSGNSNYIAAAEETGNLLLFDNSGPTPILIDTIQTGTTYGFATAISPNNSAVAMACSNGKLLLYSLSDGTELANISAHSTWVTTVAFSPNGQYLVTGGSDDKVKIWDTNGNLLFTCLGHSADVSDVKVSPDNLFVISASKDKTIKVWDIATGNLVRSIAGHTFGINCIDLSPDGTKVVSASTDRTCKIWKLETGELLSSFANPDSNEYRAVAWSPSGEKIATGNIASQLSMWSVDLDLSTKTTNQPASYPIGYFQTSSNSFHFYSKPDQNFSQIQVIDNQGKIILSLQNSQSISFQTLPSGQYFLLALDNQGVLKTQQFVKAQ